MQTWHASFSLSQFDNVAFLSVFAFPFIAFQYMLQFPRMAELMELTPYDFGKALTFLRKAALPPAVVLHLEQVDDQITEEQAWKSGSPLFEVPMPHVPLLCVAAVAGISLL